MKQFFKNCPYTAGFTIGGAGVLVVFCATIIVCRLTDKQPYNLSMYQRQCDLEYYDAKADLVQQVDSYIKSYAPESALNALALVDACDEYDIDIRFALAQGLQESHFGTKGVAAKTNSVWNVLAYDGRSAEDMISKGHGYKHPDESIKPYLKLLRDKYLVKGRTEQDLLHRFVNNNGQRYASDSTYENKLRDKYVRIETNTGISQAYSHYKHCKIIAEK